LSVSSRLRGFLHERSANGNLKDAKDAIKTPRKKLKILGVFFAFFAPSRFSG
jgi:hypothetical protein